MHLKKMSLVLSIVFLFQILAGAGGYNFSASVQAAEEKPQWSQAVIDEAVNAPLVTMNTGPSYDNGRWSVSGFHWSTNNYTAKAVDCLALMSYYDPNLKASSGQTVSERLIEHINYIMTGGELVSKYERGNELSCRGFLGGWVDGPVAQALTLAK